MKICKACEKELPQEFFSKNKKMSDGLYTYCKECAKTKKKQYRSRQEIKNKNADYARQYSEKNKERINEKKRAEYPKYAAANAARLQRWKEDNRERWLNNKKQYYRDNYDKCRQKMKERHVRQRENLEDYYVAACICQGTTLKPKEIPEDLIKAKRETILIKRLLKETT